MEIFDLERPLRTAQNCFELSTLNEKTDPNDHQRGEVSSLMTALAAAHPRAGSDLCYRRPDRSNAARRQRTQNQHGSNYTRPRSPKAQALHFEPPLE